MITLKSAVLKDAQTVALTADADGVQCSADFRLNAARLTLDIVLDSLRTNTSPAPDAPVVCEHAFGMPGDAEMPVARGMLWPVPPISGTGELGVAVKFHFDGAIFPNGSHFTIVEEQYAHITPLQVVVSECPHSFVPVFPELAMPGSLVSEPAVSHATLTVPAGTAGVPYKIKVDADYYLNVRAWKAPGDTSERGPFSCQLVMG